MKTMQRRFLCLSGFLLGVACPLLQAAQAPGWSSAPDLPLELARPVGVYFPANGNFYAMGGRMSENHGDDMTTPYEFNVKTNKWAYKTAPFPDNQVSSMACGVLTVNEHPYIYCVGGIAAGTTKATTRVFRYDPMTDTMQTAGIDRWSENALDTLPGGFAVVDNKLYILGGLTIGNTASNRIYEFDPTRPVGSQWSKKSATLPVSLCFVPATAIGNQIFTAGGSTFTPCKLTEVTNSYMYDPAKDVVALITSIPRATAETQAVTVNGEMWILGGGRNAPLPSAEVNIFNPLDGQWRSGPPMSSGLRSFAAASDGSRLLLAGGYSATSTVKTAVVIDEAPKLTTLATAPQGEK
jgi:hypothetical protein